jgi:hypothetical protein
MMMPRGYSGIASGSPITITSVTNTKIVWLSVNASELQKSLVELLTIVEVVRVETAVNPATWVVEVDDVTVVVLLTNVVVASQDPCIGASELAITGEANAKTLTTNNACFT